MRGSASRRCLKCSATSSGTVSASARSVSFRIPLDPGMLASTLVSQSTARSSTGFSHTSSSESTVSSGGGGRAKERRKLSPLTMAESASARFSASSFACAAASGFSSKRPQQSSGSESVGGSMPSASKLVSCGGGLLLHASTSSATFACTAGTEFCFATSSLLVTLPRFPGEVTSRRTRTLAEGFQPRPPCKTETKSGRKGLALRSCSRYWSKRM
mmetsp:Transcript_2400/g.8562  ORF Transcript_2400/g.8562 Transcript_2400/m.8562 type:complete len:215 (-) Transcript_2400:193-837(-)